MNSEKLEQFNKDLEFFLKDKGEGFKLEYHRPSEPSAFILWFQKHLDELGVTDVDYEFNQGKLSMKNVKYNALGTPNFPYNIEMKSNIDSPFNIKSINLKIQ
jgi:hypothetical protein